MNKNIIIKKPKTTGIASFIDEDLFEYIFTKKIDLDYFYTFDVFLKSDDKNLDSVSTKLINDYINKNSPNNFQKSKYTRTLKVLLVNILYCHQTSTKLFLAISRTSNGYSSNSRYNPIGINSIVICNLIDWLEKEKYIIQFKGVNFGKITSRTKIRAKDKLIVLFSSTKSIQAKINSRKDREVIILKDKNKKPSSYSDNRETNRMRNVVINMNSLFEKTKLELNGSVLPIQCLHRVFNDGKFNLGGRFYGGSIQNLPKTVRKDLLINGIQATEWDFSTLHPSILYHMAKKHMPKDPYLPNGYNQNAREFLKVFFLILLNSSSEDQAIRAGLGLASNKHRNLGYNLKTSIKKVLQDLKAHNHLIQKYFCKCKAKHLMFKDSQIAEKVLLHFIKQNIPIIPVHDSFIVDNSNGTQLSQIMQSCYQQVIGGNIQVGKIY